MRRHSLLWVPLLGVLCCAVGPAEDNAVASRIAALERAAPLPPAARTELAVLRVQLARETGQAGLLDSARSAVADAPRDWLAQKLEAQLLLLEEKHEQAWQTASALHRQAPDDLEVYGIMADAAIALGRYAEAETQVQWMLNLRPDNAGALHRAAQLREIWGDPEGAAELWNEILRRGRTLPPFDQAAALAAFARMRAAQGDTPRALALARQALKLAPRWLEARHTLAAIEGSDETPVTVCDDRPSGVRSSVRELLAGGKPAEALARIEPLARHYQDIETQFLLARALAANERRAEARHCLQRVLKVGARRTAILALARQLGIEETP